MADYTSQTHTANDMLVYRMHDAVMADDHTIESRIWFDELQRTLF